MLRKSLIEILAKTKVEELIFTNPPGFTLFAHITQGINPSILYPKQCGLIWGFVYNSAGEKGIKKKEKSPIEDYSLDLPSIEYVC